ncbi:ABC transporter ATP-binding protein [Streptococcus loxodontisalivarius]|uniref:ABC-2 type transport system ATP-binding protein n=1 Tax=Streptococcus loxodontisalivarius TaxID=1349415 RepID=A0ABS2PQK7_9STRE|nr:ABC transporter ATP-binding protein [Streptococcus loxodontisalivarius]MBM7642324.1 ABC-2 type transport system ATP-binding protein [Streptococcus loxodontisalivarius]
MELIVRNLHKNFQNKSVLKGADYTFKSGEITGLLGRNGAGKTTLFNILYGEFPADKGEICLREAGIERKISSDDIGMVFSENYLPDFLTAYEFIKFYMDLHAPNSDKSVDDYLDFMEISQEDRHHLIKGYSDGMKSKLSLLCILISKPKIILLDEPLTAVDVVSSIAIKRLLLEFRENHIIILSTHIMALAEDLCDSIAILDKGVLTSLDMDRKHEQFEERLLEVLKGEDYDL